MPGLHGLSGSREGPATRTRRAGSRQSCAVSEQPGASEQSGRENG